MTSPSNGTIYGLVDPRTGEVRYVGQTTKPIEVRLAGHLAAPAPLVRAWIEGLAVEGCLPQIVPLREGVAATQLDTAEREEIKAHSEQRDLLNVASNVLGNARRKKAGQEEAKRREAEERAMNLAWRQASWRQIADQIRDATGGPTSPGDIPVHPIPDAVWDTYLSYQEADRRLKESLAEGYLLLPGVGVTIPGDSPEAQEKREARQIRQLCEDALRRYVRSYCCSFSRVDEGGRRGEGVFGRGEDAYTIAFDDPGQMARYLTLIPWAARGLDPWVAVAREAGIDTREDTFVDWVSEDPTTRQAVGLFQAAGTPEYLGRRYDRGDTDIASFMLALGAAHIPGFVVPELLKLELRDTLTKVAKDRQATRAMCDLLQQIDPQALDTVYGRDRLADSDDALGLPAGLSARVIRQIFGSDQRGPDDRVGKLLQRHSGQFDTPAVPEYADWTGIHIPAMRAAAACFTESGLFVEADTAACERVVREVKCTWLPGARGLSELDDLEARLRAVHSASAP